MTTIAIICGHQHHGPACTAPAAVRIDGATRHAVACTQHRPTVEAWAATGGGPITVTTLDGATADDPQPTLF
jgi:hypothetical protein